MEELVIDRLRSKGFRANLHNIAICRIIKELEKVDSIMEIRNILEDYDILSSESNVKKILARLEDAGLISIDRDQDGKILEIAPQF